MLFKKLILLLFIGLFVALFLYPMLHEAGHITAALLLGGTIEEMSWFPNYSVLCNTTALSQGEQTAIGLAGGLLPVMVSLFPSPAIYPVWYASFLLKSINLYYCILNVSYVLLFCADSAVSNTDTTLVLTGSPETAPFLLLYFIAVLLLLSFRIKKTAPISTTLAYFFQP